MLNLIDNKDQNTSIENNSLIIKRHSGGIDYELVIHSFNDDEIKEITNEVEEFYENKINTKKTILDFLIK